MRINYNLIFCTVSFFILVCVNEPKKEEIQIAPPESTIYKYWSLLSKRDYRNALFCFTGHKDEYFDSSLIFPIPDRIESLSVDSILLKKVQGKTCVIYYRVKYFSKEEKRNKYFITGDKLVLTKKGWLIDEVLKY